MKERIKMPLSRRKFVHMGAVGLAAVQLRGVSFQPAKIKAVLFDAFVIFNPKPVFAAAEELFPGKGNDLVTLWRSKQFEYCWIRTAGTRYKDFWGVTQDALNFSAKKNGLQLTLPQTNRLMDAYLNMEIWPDVLGGLNRLKQQGISLSFLSNLTADMLNANIKHNHIESYFDHILSTDEVRLFKPNAAAYAMGMKTLNLKKEEILFAAFASWDVVGSKWFGYPTYWVNRANAQPEEMAVKADATGNSLVDMIEFIYTEAINK